MNHSSHILMIRPAHFQYNTETAVNNAFQHPDNDPGTPKLASVQFDGFVSILRAHGVVVTVIDDIEYPPTPDAVFPNNWISFHEQGLVVLYPLFAENRRAERRKEILSEIALRYYFKDLLDLSYFENQQLFLEGTGSMVLDRDHHIAYLCRSPRSDLQPLEVFCEKLNYQPVIFDARDDQGQAIYHTNVILCVGTHFAVLCEEAIPSQQERERLIQSLTHHHKEVVPITLSQVKHFAGNMLEVGNLQGENLLVLSEQAYQVLTPGQRNTLKKYTKLVYAPLDIIEKIGGGSARCMMAEIFLPPRVGLSNS